MEWFNYLLKVSACSAFFLAFYLLVLRKLTFFKINRFYLLFALLLSFVIPTLQFTVERELTAAPIIEDPVVVQNENLMEQFSLAPITAPNVSLPVEESYNWFNLLPFLYSTVVVGLLGLATWRLFRLIKHAKQNIKEINGLKLVHKSNGFTNCSFFNYVFIDENSLTESELQIMLRHEEVHAKQYHSVDKIILIIVKAVLWFNPIVYLYDKALEQIHEYEADEVTSRNFGTASYANLLLRLAVSKSDMPLVHNFVKSPIKDRIKMLFNSKSKNMKKLMYLLALPIGLGLLWGFTVKVVEVAKADKVPNESKVAENNLGLDRKLFNKTIRGKVKSISKTEVGEIIHLDYKNEVLSIFNPAKDKIKSGDNLVLKISGKVDNIMISDSKGNIIKQLDEPCLSASLIQSSSGELIYKLNNQDRPFISKTATIKEGIYRAEKFTLNTYSGKILSTTITLFGSSNETAKVYIYTGSKLYSERETLKFDKKFIASLSERRGFAKADDYDIPSVSGQKNTYVFWFGDEPKLAAKTAKSRNYAQKYNGKTIDGQIVELTYSPTTKIMDGFIIKATTGEL